MSTHDVMERDTTDTSVFVEFLSAEFPAWSFSVDATETWNGDARPLWIATQDGHHPQAALTAGKLHRRLSDYEARVAARRPDSN